MLPIPTKSKRPHHDGSSLWPRQDLVPQAAHEAGSADQLRALLCKLPLADSVGLKCLVGLLGTAHQDATFLALSDGVGRGVGRGSSVTVGGQGQSHKVDFMGYAAQYVGHRAVGCKLVTQFRFAVMPAVEAG